MWGSMARTRPDAGFTPEDEGARLHGGASADSMPSPTQRTGRIWDLSNWASEDSQPGGLPLPKPGSRHAEDDTTSRRFIR